MWEYVITVTPRQRDVAHCVRGRRRGKKRRMRRGGLYGRRGGAGGGRRRRGDTYVARARERVCVRLINQTFAFGCRGMRWRGGRKRSREEREKQAAGSGGQAGSSTRPSRAKQSQALSFSLSLRATLGQAPTSVTPTLPHPRRYLPRALFLCRSYAHAPLAPSTDPQSHSRGVLSPSACLPASACRSVGSRFPSRNPPCSDSRALSLLSPLPLTSRGYVSLARGINTPVGRLRAAKRPKPRSRKRRRLYRVTPRAAFVAPCAASESIDFEICSNRSAHPDFP